MGTPMLAVLQILAIAVAVLQDRASEPLFPRWAGYLNVWTAVLFVPGTCGYFFLSGPLAWRGVFTWWIPLTAFGVWLAVMVRLLLAAIARTDGATTTPDAPHSESASDLSRPR